MSRLDGDPAFPCNSPDGVETYKGMSLRDWFAGQALAGYLANNGYLSQTAERAYEIADAMLKEREK